MAMKNNPFEPILKFIPLQLRNRYFLIVLLFFVWMFFFDKHRLPIQMNLQNTVDELEEEKDFYSDQIDHAEEERLELEIDKEKIAREKYFMKRPNEDVYIIVDEDDKKN